MKTWTVISLKCGLLPPLKGEVPRRGGGVASPEIRIFDSWEGDRRRRRWWRGSSHLTVRTVPKYVRFAHCFGTGGGVINPFPEFYGNRKLTLRDFGISPPCLASPDWGAAPNPAQSFTVSRSEIDDIVVEVKLSPYPLHSKG